MRASFAGRVAFITGASSGIGAAVAHEFAGRGADVVLAARRLERLEALAAQLRGGGHRAVAVRVDVTQDGSLERGVEATLAAFGRLDVVVANAGFSVVDPLLALTLDDYRRQFETNVFGILRTVYATLKPLRRTPGALVLVGSIAGHVASPGSSAYAMSKFAVRALAEALRPELAIAGVGVVLVSPGFVESEIFQVDNHGVWHQEILRHVPRRLKMPTDRAARLIVRATARRPREVVITGHGKVLVWLARHVPWLVAWVHRRAASGAGRGADRVSR